MLSLNLNSTRSLHDYTLAIFASAVYATRNQGDDASKAYLQQINDTFGVFTDLDQYSSQIKNGEYANSNASALVRRDGNRLMIAFRGTDDAKDVFDDMSGVASGNFNRHYKKFDVFIKAIERYLKDHAEIMQIDVTGHSLGGAMADAFLLNHSDTKNYKIQGVTFASPGYQKHSPTDFRTTQYEMVSDLVGDTFQNLGNIINLDDHVSGKSISNHGIQNHIDYLAEIHQNELELNFNLNYASQYRIDIQDQHLKSYSVEITGSKKSETLIGTNGNDNLNGAQGNDILISNGGNDTLTGGSGKDSFVFNLENNKNSYLISNKISDFISSLDQVKFIADDLKFSEIQFSAKKLSIPKYNFELTFTKTITFKENKNVLIVSNLA